MASELWAECQLKGCVVVKVRVAIRLKVEDATARAYVRWPFAGEAVLQPREIEQVNVPVTVKVAHDKCQSRDRVMVAHVDDACVRAFVASRRHRIKTQICRNVAAGIDAGAANRLTSGCLTEVITPNRPGNEKRIQSMVPIVARTARPALDATVINDGCPTKNLSGFI